MIFLAVLPALEVEVNSNLMKIGGQMAENWLQLSGCQMIKKGPKDLINQKDSRYIEQYAMSASPLSAFRLILWP